MFTKFSDPSKSVNDYREPLGKAKY